MAGVAHPDDRAEPTRIDEPQLAPGAEVEDQVGVRLEEGVGGFDGELPGHAQMDVEAFPRVEREDDPLGASAQVVDPSAGQTRGQIESRGFDHVRAPVRQATDHTPAQVCCERGDNVLNLW